MIVGFLYALCIVLCVLGISDLIFLIKLKFISPKKKYDDFVLVLLDESDYKLQLYTAIQKRNWYGNLYCKKIIAFTDNLDGNAVSECKKLFTSQNVVFCDNIKEYGLFTGIKNE